MKRFFVFVLTSICLINLAFAQQMATIDPELYALMNSKSGEKINVNIVLKEKIDANQFNVRKSFSSRDAQRTYIMEELKAQTEKSQADLLKTLKANERSVQVTDVKCHWLTNMINCNATPDAILKIAEHPDVEAVFYNKLQKLILDTKVENTVQTRASNATNVTQVNAPQVWNLGITGKGVVVAVIDSGVNTSHVDLQDHLWNDGNGHYGYNTYNGNNDITDDFGHGTHCAGTICGDGTSGTATGIAPDATLMCIKAMGSDGNGTVDSMIEAVEYAADNGADVLSMSVGISGPDDYSSAVFRNLFVNTLAQNIVVTAAAGNDGNSLSTYPTPKNINTPGNCPPPWIHPDQEANAGGKTSVICVGALDYEATGKRPGSSVGPVTWQSTSWADYGLGKVYTNKETLQYDNGTYLKNYSWTTADMFAILFTPSELAEFSNGAVLTSVYIYDALEDGGLFYVCQGGNTPSEATQLHSQTYNHYGAKSMFEIALDQEVTIDKNQNLWIVFQPTVSGSTIPVATNTDSPNARWLYRNGAWTNSYISEAIMVRANISTGATGEEYIGLIRPDVVAPGSNIVSASNTDNSGFSTQSGTSMATPCVAGTIALLLEANPNLSPADICRVLETTAVKVEGATAKNNRTGSGRIDAYNAVLTVATNLELTAPTLTATAKSSSQIDLSWTIAPGADSYTIYRNGDEIASGITTTSYSDTDLNLNPETTYSYKVKAIRGSESVESDAVSATTKAEDGSDDGGVCVIQIEMFDSYGDGWNGDCLAYSINGSALEALEFTSGSTQTYTLEINKGAKLYIEYQGSNSFSENSLTIRYQDGDVLYTSDSPYGSKIVDVTVDCAGSTPSTPEPEEPEEPTAPATPTGLVATVQSSSSISLTWSAVAGATSYNVYRNSSVNPIATVATGTSYTDTNLTPATNCCYTVSAVNANVDLESEKSAEVCETTETESETPSVSQYRIKAVGRSASAGVSYYLNIENNDQHETGSKGGVGLATYAENDSQIFEIEEVYGSQVYVKSASGYYIYCNGDWNVDAFSTYSATSLELEDAGDGAYYIHNSNGYFKVDPDAGGSGKYYPYSNGSKSDREKWILEPVGSSTPEAPSAPQNLVATAQSSSSISLTWAAVDGATSYNVYRDSRYVGNTTETYYTDNGLTPVTNYCYTVTALKDADESVSSEEDCETTQSVSVDHNGMEKVVTIGGTQKSSNLLPFNTWSYYSYSQQIYTKAEIDPDGIAVGGKITKIAFKQSNSHTETRNIVVYMQNTNKTSFTGTKNWAAVAAVDKVFDGDVTLPGTGGSLEITLNSPIEYTGGNILISIYDKTTAFNGQAEFYTYSTNAYRALQTQGISCNPETMSGSSITGEKYDSNNSIDFTFVLPVNEYTGNGSWTNIANWSKGVVPISTDDVVINGDVTITAGAVVVNSITINNNASLTVKSGASLRVIGGFINDNASAFIIEDGAEVFQTNSDVEAMFKMNVVAPSTWDNHTEGWQFVASPVKEAATSEFETGGTDYDLFKYDGLQELQWVNYKNHTQDFETEFQQGRAYLVSYETSSEVEFSGILNHETSFNFVGIEYNEYDVYANFYLLGNPFAFNMDWANVTAEGLASGLAVVTLDGTYKYAVDTIINVGDGFFVQVTDAEPSLTYNSNVRSRRVKHNFINIMASGKSGSDNVILNFAGNDEEGFAKLENFNKDVAEIYVKDEGRRYGILNYAQDVEEIELYFDAKRMGEYTINAVTEGEFESVILVDRNEGVETDLLTSSYTFTSATNENSERFTLRIKHEKENENFVYQSGSELVIDAEGLVQVMDVMGRIVYSGEQNGVNRVDIGGMNSSTYIIRNVNNNEVRIQKIVVF